MERLASLPELDRLVEADVAALQPGDDLAQLALRLLERDLGGHVCTSLTSAESEPRASSTARLSPTLAAEASRRTVPPARTIA